MIAALAFASALLAQAAAPLALDGFELGGPAKDVATAHKGAPVQSKAGPTWSFARAGGGTVKVTADDDGNVAMIDVTIKGAAGTIDLPGAKAFPIASAHEKYSDMSSNLESDSCSAPAPVTCYAFTLEDGSDLLLQFDAQGRGPLREVLWGDRKLLKQLGLITAATSI